MIALGHTGIGTLIGIASYQTLGKGDIALGLVATGCAGVISHYLADLLPHGHFFGAGKYEKLIIWVILFDLMLPVLLILGLAHYLGRSGSEILYILFGIGGAQLPDVLDGLKTIRLLPKIGLLEAENKFHQSTHWHGIGDKLIMISFFDVWQFLVLTSAIIVLIFN